MYSVWRPMPLDRKDQCVPFEPLVDNFGRGPSTPSQAWLSGLVISGLKTYNTMVQNNPWKNICYDPALKTIQTKLLRYKKWTRRNSLISATTGSNLEHQRVIYDKVMHCATLSHWEGCMKACMCMTLKHWDTYLLLQYWGGSMHSLWRKVWVTKLAPKKNDYIGINIEGGDRDVKGDQLLRFTCWIGNKSATPRGCLNVSEKS